MVDGVPAELLRHDCLQRDHLELDAHVPVEDCREQLLDKLYDVRLPCPRTSMQAPTERLPHGGACLRARAKLLHDTLGNYCNGFVLLRVREWPAGFVLAIL